MKKSRLYSMLLIGLMCIGLMSSCSTEVISQGEMGVLIRRPYLFGSSGTEVLTPDRYYVALSTTVVKISVRPIQIKEVFNDLTTKDNVPVDFDICFTLKLLDNKVDTLYSNFGLDYYVKMLEPEFRNLTRDKCKQYEMTPLTNDAKVSEDINAYIKEEGNKIIKKLKIPVILIAVNMGSVNPPQAVTSERGKTAAAKQNENTIVQENINQIKRKQSEESRALADKAYQNALNLTTDQYIQLQALAVRKIGYEKAKDVTIIEGDNIGLNKSVK